MKVCVVGGTGNISTAVVDLLCTLNHEVVCFNRGNRAPARPEVHTIVGDRDNEETFIRTMQREKFDAAIDMVCFSAEHARADLRAFDGVRHFIFVSSPLVYGPRYEALPVAETHRIRPSGPYAKQKAAAERVLLDASCDTGFPATVLRVALVWGEQKGLQAPGLADNHWLERIRLGKPIVFPGNPDTPLPVIHPDDVAPAFAYGLGRPGFAGEIFNVAHPRPTTWRHYFETLMTIIGARSEIVAVPVELIEKMSRHSDQLAHPAMLCRRALVFDSSKLSAVVPEFNPGMPLEAHLARVYRHLAANELLTPSSGDDVEDALVEEVRELESRVAARLERRS